MTAVAGSLRFYADESVLGVGKALSIARKDLVYPGHPLLADLPLGTLDPVWIPAVAAMGLVVIARDRRIRTKPVERKLLATHALRVFWIAGRSDMDNWGNLKLLVTKWEQMEEIIEERGDGPWFYGLSQSAITELPI